MSRRIARARGQAGFTLVELLVVIAILGILSGVVVFAVRGIGDKGRGVAVATDERILRTAEESYCAQNGRYGAEHELVRDGFLTGMSEYHAIAVGDDPNDPLVFDQTASAGHCGESYKHYQIVCRDGSPMPNCGTPSGPPTSTSTTVPASSTWVALSQGPSSRYAAGMAEYPPGNQVVMFGGRGAIQDSGVGAYAGDTWTWGGGWVLAAPPAAVGCDKPPLSQTTPCPRFGHGMAYDPRIGKVVMAGGQYAYQGTGQDNYRMTLRETWTWDGAWKLVQSGPQVPQSAHGAMAYDGHNVVLFGGFVDVEAEGGLGFVRSGATWIWNGGTWSEVLVPGPQPRSGVSMAYDPASRQVILFGGQDSEGRYLGDTWAWNGAAKKWAQLAPPPPPAGPKPRSFAAMATMGSGSTGTVVLFGGTPSDETNVAGSDLPGLGGKADTWVWDGPNRTWIPRQPTASPPGRAYVPLAYHQATDQLVMFGGNQVLTGSPETWGYKSTPATPSTTVP